MHSKAAFDPSIDPVAQLAYIFALYIMCDALTIKL